MRKLLIDIKRRTGQVIYVVEGDSFEIKLLQHIFCEVLGYEVVSYNKKEDKFLYMEGYIF